MLVTHPTFHKLLSTIVDNFWSYRPSTDRQTVKKINRDAFNLWTNQWINPKSEQIQLIWDHRGHLATITLLSLRLRRRRVLLSRRLCSDSSHELFVPRTRLSTYGDRTFPVAAVRIWNSLPQHVTSAPSLPVFCTRLKTYFFELCYS